MEFKNLIKGDDNISRRLLEEKGRSGRYKKPLKLVNLKDSVLGESSIPETITLKPSLEKSLANASVLLLIALF